MFSGNRHLILVKGHCGIGKSNRTAEEIKMLYRPDGESLNSPLRASPVSILIISGRRSLARGQKTLYDGFKSYIDLDIQKLNPKDTPKLVISPINSERPAMM